MPAVAVAWGALILIAPGWRSSAASAPRRTVAVLIYVVAAPICHQRADRSFWLAGQPLPVCGRCTGLYLSGALGALAATRGRRG
ncbi:MAG: DUF2085 domain-containing protein, partial [Acidobacteria bacterium]|nr:DUF2085 domain-containing protein [Acidobacteriota bacterium]